MRTIIIKHFTSDFLSLSGYVQIAIISEHTIYSTFQVVSITQKKTTVTINYKPIN